MHAPDRHARTSSSAARGPRVSRSSSPLLPQPQRTVKIVGSGGGASGRAPPASPVRASPAVRRNIKIVGSGSREPPSYFAQRSPSPEPAYTFSGTSRVGLRGTAPAASVEPDATAPLPQDPDPSVPALNVSSPVTAERAAAAEVSRAHAQPELTELDSMTDDESIRTPKSQPSSPRPQPPSVTPFTTTPHGAKDYQRLANNGHGQNGAATMEESFRTEACSEVDAAEVTCMELSDSEAVGLDSPRGNPLEHLQRNGGAGGGDAMPEYNLAHEIALLRKEYMEQSKKLHERIAMVEESTIPTEDQQREAHLNYLRKWMERMVNQVCRAHPTATDVTTLLQDFQGRLRAVVPEDYAALEGAEPGSPAIPQIFSPLEPQSPSFNQQPQAEKSSCCTVQ